MLRVAAGPDEDRGGELWMEERGYNGEKDSFREHLKVEGDFLSLEPASGSPHTGPIRRPCAVLLWAGLGTYPSRPQDCFPQ